MDVGSEESAVEAAVPSCSVVLSDVGKRRNENQDSFGILHTSRGSLYLVADGMGGAQGGATASAIAVEVVAKYAITQDERLTEDSLVSSIRLANSAIHSYAQKDEKLAGMGTTLVALAIFSDRALVAHVGDSRIYLLNDRGFSQLTRDHTLVQELMDAGTISAEQAENHPISHMLTRSIGPTEKVDVELQWYPLPAMEGDRFLLCCDGLCNHVSDEEIEKILDSKDNLRDAAEMLVELANQRGGTDNITVLIVEVCDDSSSDRKDIKPGSPAFTSSAEKSFIDELDLGDASEEELPPEDESQETADATEDADGDESEDAEVESEESDFEEDEPSENGTASGSAFDSVMFGENPTTEEVREQQRRMEEQRRAAEDDIEDLDDEIQDDFAFIDEQAQISEDEVNTLQRISRLAIGVICFAALTIAVLLVLSSTNDESVDVADETTQAEVEPVAVAAVDPNSVTTETPDAPEVKVEDTSSSAESSQDAGSTSAIDVPATTIVDPTDDLAVDASAPSGDSGANVTVSSDANQNTSDSSDQAWPEVDVMEDKKKEQQEALVATLTSSEKTVSKAQEIQLSEATAVIKEKSDLRQRLDELEFELSLLTLPTQEEVVKRRATIEKELKEVSERLTSESSVDVALLEAWNRRAGLVSGGHVVAAAEDMATTIRPVHEQLQMYKAAQMLFDNAKDVPPAVADSIDHAERLSTLEGEVTTQKAALKTKVQAAIEEAMGGSGSGTQSPAAQKLLTEKRRLEGQLHSLENFRWGLGMERLDRQLKLEEEKQKIERRLELLRLDVSDAEEAEITSAMKQSSTKP